MKPRFRILCALLIALASTLVSPAKAEWHEASSEHFVIYADDSPKDLRRYAENLELYHSAMEFVTGGKTPAPTPSNRVVIFAVGNQRDIRRLAGSDSRFIAGFYIPRAGASRAFVQDIRNTNGYPHFSTIVLLHEYAHHFLISQSRFAMPRWMSEGAAEFFASASFEKDGTVMIGRPARHRGAELLYAEDVSLLELLDHELYDQNRGRRYDAFYGRSWLLYHYLTFKSGRSGQLAAYWRAVIAGKPSVEAARDAFGDLAQLERELNAYARSNRMKTFSLPAEKLNASPVSLRKLPEGEAQIMPLRIRSQRGVTEEEAREIVAEVRVIAASFPDDPGVLTALAEAEYDAGNDLAAIAAADRGIARDPARTNAHVQKGLALFRLARDAADKAAAYDKAMQAFSQLNAIENDHPLPLIHYFRFFTERGLEPPETARHALERAAQLAPFDKSLWLELATLQLREGKIALARASLEPLANDPHGGSYAAKMQQLVAQLANLPEGEPVKIASLLPTDQADSDAGAQGDDAGAQTP